MEEKCCHLPLLLDDIYTHMQRSGFLEDIDLLMFAWAYKPVRHLVPASLRGAKSLFCAAYQATDALLQLQYICQTLHDWTREKIIGAGVGAIEFAKRVGVNKDIHCRFRNYEIIRLPLSRLFDLDGCSPSPGSDALYGTRASLQSEVVHECIFKNLWNVFGTVPLTVALSYNVIDIVLHRDVKALDSSIPTNPAVYDFGEVLRPVLKKACSSANWLVASFCATRLSYYDATELLYSNTVQGATIYYEMYYSARNAYHSGFIVNIVYRNCCVTVDTLLKLGLSLDEVPSSCDRSKVSPEMRTLLKW